MNIDIIEYIKNNFKDSPVDEIKDSIISSINEKDEVTLPGMVLLFEILWSNSDEDTKNNILNTIKNNLK